MESLPDVAWLSGLVDGEGCFSCWVHDYEDGRVTILVRMSLDLRADDRPALERGREIARGAGAIRLRQPRTPGGNPQACWTVAGRKDCATLADVLAPYPPQSKKRRDYMLWLKALDVYSKMKRGGREARRHNQPYIDELRRINHDMKEVRKYVAT